MWFMISQSDNTIEKIRISWIMAKNAKTKVNYGMLLCKLKTELTHNETSAPKKPKVEKTYQLTKVQWKLLNVCGFRAFKNPPMFKFVPKVNQFVIKCVDKKTIFLQQHDALPCWGQSNFF